MDGDQGERRDESLTRSSTKMAIGTVASRGTGFARVVVIASALGTGLLGNAYVTANTTPNIVYELLLGGILTSVVVPLLVKAERSGDGDEYARRLLSTVVYGLGAVTVGLMIGAPLLIDLYGAGFTPAQHNLAVLMARFFLPQIVFYGVGAVLAAILNTRGKFAAPMWAPVVNNIVVVATGLLFVAVASGSSRVPGELSQGAVLLLAGGTTLGIVAQTAVLVPALRAVGFTPRLTLRLRGVGLLRTWRLARWMLVYVAANQVGLVVLVGLANRAAAASRDAGDPNTGYATYSYAFQIFQLPHAVIAVSVITALLPRMSRAAADGRLADMRKDLARGTRLAITGLVPAAVALIVMHRQIGVLVFARGEVSVPEARAIGVVVAGFALGLVPFSLFQLHLRAFYALSDTRAPALVNIAVNAANVAAAATAYALLPAQHRVAGIAATYSLSYVLGLACTFRMLAKRVGPLDGRRLLGTASRVTLSALVSGVLAGIAATATTAEVADSTLGALAGLAAGCMVGGVTFLAVVRKAGVPEVAALLDVSVGRLRR